MTFKSGFQLLFELQSPHSSRLSIVSPTFVEVAGEVASIVPVVPGLAPRVPRHLVVAILDYGEVVAPIREIPIVQTKANDVGRGAELFAEGHLSARYFLVQVKLVKFVDCGVHLGRLSLLGCLSNTRLLIRVASFV